MNYSFSSPLCTLVFRHQFSLSVCLPLLLAILPGHLVSNLVMIHCKKIFNSFCSPPHVFYVIFIHQSSRYVCYLLLFISSPLHIFLSNLVLLHCKKLTNSFCSLPLCASFHLPALSFCLSSTSFLLALLPPSLSVIWC